MSGNIETARKATQARIKKKNQKRSDALSLQLQGFTSRQIANELKLSQRQILRYVFHNRRETTAELHNRIIDLLLIGYSKNDIVSELRCSQATVYRTIKEKKRNDRLVKD